MTKEEIIKSREKVMFFFNEEEDPSQEHYKKWDFIHGTNNNTPVKTGQFSKYPHLWKPLYYNDVIRDKKLNQLGINE